MLCAFHAACIVHALNPHSINAIRTRHAVENWGIKIPPGTATRFAFKLLVQGHAQYFSQAATPLGFAKEQLFLESSASTIFIHDALKLTNVRPLSEPEMFMLKWSWASLGLRLSRFLEFCVSSCSTRQESRARSL